MKKLLYIHGAGSSGSTILSLLLGTHPQITDAGEINELDKRSGSEPSCSCGQLVSKCTFWSELCSGRCLYTNPILPEYLLFTPYYSKTTNGAPFIEANDEILNRIAESFNTNVIVDASKQLQRLHSIRKNSEEWTVLPIYLVRDLRAYIYSMRKKNIHGPFYSVLRWTKKNLYSALYRVFYLGDDDENIKMTYTELTKKTSYATAKISKLLDVEKEGFNNKIEHTSHHVAGTKISHGKPIEITAIESWKNELKTHEKVVYYVTFGPLLNLIFKKLL